MGEANEQQDPAGRRFSQEQYNMLKHCSDKKDMTEWNQWREQHPDTKVSLQKAELPGMDLRKANLRKADLYGADLKGAILSHANLEGATLLAVDLRGAQLFAANLQGATLGQSGVFELSSQALLKDQYILTLDARHPFSADMREARLPHANLRGARLSQARMEGTDFRWALVDGETEIWTCHLDRRSDFRGVGLASVRIDAASRQLLEYNERRRNWHDWYRQHSRLALLVKPFWWTSNYGLSTGRIAGVFFVMAIAFAVVYYVWGLMSPPGIVDNLFLDTNGVAMRPWIVPLRALFFSLVTMTVGFTDMRANPHSIWAYILVTSQMLLGYILLGALITRFAVLFTAGGPAGTFADEMGIISRLWKFLRGKWRKKTD